MERRKCCCGGEAEQKTESGQQVMDENENAVGLEDESLSCGQTGRECCRTRNRSEQEMRDLIHRLNRVEGQIRGIRSMVEEERYCVDILTQVAAAKAALNGFSQALLDQHIRTCVADRLQEGDMEVVDELTAVMRKLMK